MTSKIAIVTGGASGIGKAIVSILSLNNIHCLVIDKNKAGLDSLLTEIPNISVFAFDISDFSSLNGFIARVKKDYSSIDYLVNNAAIQVIESLDMLNPVDTKLIFEVNLFAPMHLISKLYSHMKRDSCILNISSVHGTIPRLNKFAYDASKAALDQFTKEAALSLAPLGIRVNALAPGATKTPMNNNFENEESLLTSQIKIPLGYVASAEQVARAAVYYLINDDYTTGAIIPIDGGRSLK